MTNENKLASMDAVGELPEMGNLLLREGGFPHLPDPVFVPEKKADAWNDAGTKPKVAGVYKTRLPHDELSVGYQRWTGVYWAYPSDTKEDAQKTFGVSCFQNIQWREVQP